MKYRPFRKVGKSFVIGTDRITQDDKDHATVFAPDQPLTVLGFGSVSFSAFYPSCRSVFGLHDGSMDSQTGLTYSVIGWNASADNDIVRQLLQQKPEQQKVSELLKDQFNINIQTDQPVTSGTTTLYYGQLKIAELITRIPKLDDGLSYSLANSGSEAISMLLAEKITPGDKKVIEDQLEFMMMSSKLGALTVDTGPKFIEARHAKGFTGSDGGFVYAISSKAKIANERLKSEVIALEIATHLNNLNQQQFEVNKLQNEVSSLQRQVYCDWYKYVKLTGPSPGDQTTTNSLYDYLNQSVDMNTKLGDLEEKKKALKISPDRIEINNYIQQYNLEPQNNFELSLVSIPDANFYEPNEPVIAINRLPRSGSTQSPEAYADLPGYIIQSESNFDLTDAGQFIPLYEQVKKISLPDFWVSRHSEQKWNPFILEWETELRQNMDIGANPPSDALTSRYYLDPNSPSLVALGSESETTDPIYQGSTLLTTSVTKGYLSKLEGFVEDYLNKKRVSGSIGNPVPEDKVNILKQKEWKDVQVISGTKYGESARLDDPQLNPLYTAWKAYALLSDWNVVSQSFGGFNEALITRLQTPQLPVANPLEPQYYNFHKTIADFVGNESGEAPAVDFKFNPIRDGTLRVGRLRLIDNFGINSEIPRADVKMSFVPRIVQPARLNFYFLSGASDDLEMNSHPATSPVCGWIMPNYLEKTLSVFDEDGHALGYLADDEAKKNIVFNHLPWTNSGLAPVKVSNQNLQKLIDRIKADNRLDAFISVIQNSQDNIAPSDLSHSSQALLMGRPIAVVRAKLDIELKGLPAIDQSEASLKNDIAESADFVKSAYAERSGYKWSEIKFPVRLGEFQQLNDGLVGYWKEDGGALGDIFFAPEFLDDTEQGTADQIADHGDNFSPLTLDAAENDITVMMLMEPRGVVHATTGILPTKLLSIPQDQYLPALNRLSVWFEANAILQPAAGSDEYAFFNLPAVADYAWNWQGTGKSLPIVPLNANGLSEQLPVIRDGWLTLSSKPSEK